MTNHDTHMLLMVSALFKTAHALRATDVETQTVVNKFLEHVLYYMNNGLIGGSESTHARLGLAREICNALSPVYDVSAFSDGATLEVPVDEGYYGDDYYYKYLLFFRDKDNKLGVHRLTAPPPGGYIRSSLLDNHLSDVVVIHLTLASTDDHCVSFSTYRVKQQTN